MPAPPALAESNRSQTERMRQLVGRLDAAMQGVGLPNGWTVAGALAHVAFWDRWRLCLMHRDGGVFSAALQPLLELIPPERAAAAAAQAAAQVAAPLPAPSD